MALPSTIIYFISKNGSWKLQFKLFQCSKTMQKLIQKIRGGRQVDDMLVYIKSEDTKNTRENKLTLAGGDIFLKISANNIKNLILVKDNLEFCNINFAKYSNLLSLIKPKQIEKFHFNKCKISKNIEAFLIPSIKHLYIFSCQFFDDYDVLYNALLKLPNLETIAISWQNGVSSFEKLNKIEKNKKIRDCNIIDITEMIHPKLIAKFVYNQIEENGELYLSFSINFPKKEYKIQIEDELKKLSLVSYTIRINTNYIYQTDYLFNDLSN